MKNSFSTETPAPRPKECFGPGTRATATLPPAARFANRTVAFEKIPLVFRKRPEGSGQALPLFLLLFSSLTLSSCDWFKPAQDPGKVKVYKEEDIGEIQGKKVFDPETGEWRTVHEVSGKVETVQWTALSEEKFPPITSDSDWSTSAGGATSGGGGGGGRSVAVMLPFLANRSTGGSAENVDEDALWAIHFYGGAQLAYDDLERDGVSLDVSVLDDEGSTAKVETLLRGNSLQRADLVIGPYKRDNVVQAAEFAKTSRKPLVVPYTAQMGVTENNPYYIQVNPSLRSHCEAITRHLRKRHRTEDVVLVARNKDEEAGRLKYFQDENAAIEGGRPSAKFREYVVADETGDFRKIDVSPYVREGRTTVFVVPSWSSETFVYSLLRQLMFQQSQGEDIVVYGMPQWMNFEQVDFEFYEKLKVHVSSASYLNDADERVRQFKRKFFDAFGTVPREEAFLGYDVMLYFGKMTERWGADLPMRIDRSPFDVLHGRFEFERVVLEPERHRENLDYFDQLENKFVHILEFRDFHFQPAD